MSENIPGDRPCIWLIDAEQAQPDAEGDAFAPWADCLHFVWNEAAPDWSAPPDAVFFSAEIPGGANGEFFARLVEHAGSIPLIAVARLRSLAQAVAYFRAGAADYLSLPLTEEEARSCFAACVARAARLSARNAPTEPPEEEDILAQVPPPQPAETLEQHETIEAPETPAPEPEQESEWLGLQTFVNDMPLPLAAPARAVEEEAAEASPAEEEPMPVDGLPIPSLLEELPCGLLLFDSLGNLVFANRPGLELLGRDTLAELQDALENKPASFAAHSLNHKPLPDNQWPHILAVKTRAPRSAVLSVETGDRRRSWLRIDCQPHLADGKIARLSMTLVNLTGELPPLRLPENAAPPPSPPRKDRKDKAKQRGRKKE